jgi:hypothetical protein
MGGVSEQVPHAVQRVRQALRDAGRRRAEPAGAFARALSPEAVLGLLRASRSTIQVRPAQAATDKVSMPRSSGAHQPR